MQAQLAALVQLYATRALLRSLHTCSKAQQQLLPSIRFDVRPVWACAPASLLQHHSCISQSQVHMYTLTDQLHQLQRQQPFLSLPGVASDLSKKHKERRLVGWSPQQLYEVVADVSHYNEFVPWCQRSVVTLQREDYMEAELEVGFRVFVERYTSRISLQPGQAVHSQVTDSTLFDHLDCHWEFAPGPTPASCWLTFRIDFAFKSQLYRHAASMFFEEVVQRMMSAFQGRAAKVFGPSSLVRRRVQQQQQHQQPVATIASHHS